ncbi:protein ataf2-like [Hordeum vulgare]|uniref:Holliday junction resolvase MOC1, chloroplastic-like n=1 Tax=Hordeum vulgare subsp. vulgare TaxID=112509 RepID=UPI001D1A4A14|nr:Holliday junction resolvase MOC1, chloroplastic-like [Hordeum vulgare subsp. vulgare]KAE8784454.1 protein ataf2-like [Hordeum vulgare]
MASAGPDPDPQPPARPPLFAIPSDLEAIELLRLWKEGGAAAVPSWIRPAEVYGHSPSELLVAHQPATAADGAVAWFLVTTVRHVGPKDPRICRVVKGGGTWKGEHSHPLVSLPDRALVGTVRSLSYTLKGDDGKELRTGHLMREYRLSGGAGLVAGSAGLEIALCVVYNSPRDAEAAAAKALERAAAKAAKEQEKTADRARRAAQADAIKARRAAAMARRRGSSKAQEVAAANAAAAVAADTPAWLALVSATTPPRGQASATPTPLAAATTLQRAAAATPPPQAAAAVTPPLQRAAAAATTTPLQRAAATPPLQRAAAAATTTPLQRAAAAAAATTTPLQRAAATPPLQRAAAAAAATPLPRAGSATPPPASGASSPVGSASCPQKRQLLLEVGADPILMPGSSLSWNQVYDAQQVEGDPPFKRTKRLDCSGWFLLDAGHTRKFGQSPCSA